MSRPNVQMDIYKKKGLSRTEEIDFEAVEDVINSISAGKGQYPLYLQSYIQKFV